MAQLLLLVLVVGLASQWLAWRIKLPAISPELAKDLARISELWGEGLRRFGA